MKLSGKRLLRKVIGWLRGSEITRQKSLILDLNTQLKMRESDLAAIRIELSRVQKQNETLEATREEWDGESKRLNEACINLEQANNSMREEIRSLVNENNRLRIAVNERESQIFSLQPYHKELTIDEARREYGNLVLRIIDWVEKWTDDITRNDEILQMSLDFAKKNPQAIHEFRKWMSPWEDLVQAIRLPDYEQEVIRAFILRYLGEYVFAQFLGSVVPEFGRLLDHVVMAMNEHTNPKPDLFAIQSWQAQACIATLSHPETKSREENATFSLSMHLANLLSFIPCSRENDIFMRSISSSIVEPAMRLQEKFLMSTNLFRLEMDSRISSGQPIPSKVTGDQIFSFLKNLDCVNIAENNRKFIVEKLRPKPRAEFLRENLTMICSIQPALTVTEVSQGNSLKEPRSVYDEQVLVSWNPRDGKTTPKPEGQNQTHRVAWHHDHTCDEYDAFLADPQHFRSMAQLEKAAVQARDLENQRLDQQIRDAETRFHQSMMREEEAAEARRQERIKREHRLAQERAEREEAERRDREARQLATRLAAEEAETGRVFHRLSKPCPNCRIPIEKYEGWSALQS
ncbi:hypothetical protein F5B20DRAFT_597452 [Whalleya microplaca]|nr:hypothetical protein F5B20DRAFT_597452 [Whalleya microplaca]